MKQWWGKIFLGLIILMIALSVAVLALGEKSHLRELSSPSDWIKEDQIKVYDSKVILDVPHTHWAKFTDTNSMDPVLDDSSNALEITPTSPDEIKVGDIISYNSEYGIIIHRVIEKGLDQEGVYYTVKGDNSPFTDPIKVRFKDVTGVVIAIIY